MSLKLFIQINYQSILDTVKDVHFDCLCNGFDISKDDYLKLKFENKLTGSDFIRKVFSMWNEKENRTIDDFIKAFNKAGYLTFSTQLRQNYKQNAKIYIKKNNIDF